MYDKPVIFETGDIAEGIYLASGSTTADAAETESGDCWKVVVKKAHQKSECGRKTTVFQIDMDHVIRTQAHHDRKPQRLYLVFDRCCDVVRCNEGCLVGNGKGVSQIEVDFYTCDNGGEHIGWGGLEVSTCGDCPVNITKAWMTD